VDGIFGKLSGIVGVVVELVMSISIWKTWRGMGWEGTRSRLIGFKSAWSREAKMVREEKFERESILPIREEGLLKTEGEKERR
jgi:hypothetical protein